MAEARVVVTAVLGEMERVCAALGWARGELGGRTPSEVEVGLDEATHAAHRALVALRASYRATAPVPQVA